MPHLEVRVDGELKYEGDVPAAAIPQRPRQYPQAMGYGAQPGSTLPYLARLSALTSIIEVLQQLANSPQLQPMSMEVTRYGMGRATIELEIPEPVGAPAERGPIAL